MENCIESSDHSSVPEISVAQLAQLIERGSRPFLIDVREPFERSLGHLGGILIPGREVAHRLTDIPRDLDVVIYSQTGDQGRDVVSFLSENYGFTNLVNLAGGIVAWSQDIDPTFSPFDISLTAFPGN